jgi:hypothetical protein
VRGAAFVVFGGAFFEENPLPRDVHLAHPQIGKGFVPAETAGVGASDERAQSKRLGVLRQRRVLLTGDKSFLRGGFFIRARKAGLG